MSFWEWLTGWVLAPSASTVGPKIDHLYHLTLWISVVFFVLVHTTLAVILWRYRKGRRPAAEFRHSHRLAEIFWTAGAASILITLGLLAQNLWSSVKTVPTNPALTIRVHSEQWLWRFQYPGPDGRLDTPDDVLVDNVAHIPTDATVVFELTSRDVVHGFYIPDLRLQNDAVPGITTKVWTQATRPGVFDIRCTQFCGTNHYQMRGELVVEDQAAFQTWQKSSAEAVF